MNSLRLCSKRNPCATERCVMGSWRTIASGKNSVRVILDVNECLHSAPLCSTTNNASLDSGTVAHFTTISPLTVLLFPVWNCHRKPPSPNDSFRTFNPPCFPSRSRTCEPKHRTQIHECNQYAKRVLPITKQRSWQSRHEHILLLSAIPLHLIF